MKDAIKEQQILQEVRHPVQGGDTRDDKCWLHN